MAVKGIPRHRPFAPAQVWVGGSPGNSECTPSRPRDDLVTRARRLTRGRLASGRVSRDARDVHGGPGPSRSVGLTSPSRLRRLGQPSSQRVRTHPLGAWMGTPSIALRPCLPTPGCQPGQAPHGAQAQASSWAGFPMPTSPGGANHAHPGPTHPKLGFDALRAGDSLRYRDTLGSRAARAPRLEGIRLFAYAFVRSGGASTPKSSYRLWLKRCSGAQGAGTSATPRDPANIGHRQVAGERFLLYLARAKAATGRSRCVRVGNRRLQP